MDRQVYEVPRLPPLLRIALVLAAVGALGIAALSAFGKTMTEGGWERTNDFGSIAGAVGVLGLFLAFLLVVMSVAHAAVAPRRMWIEGGRLRASRRLPPDGLHPMKFELRTLQYVGLIVPFLMWLFRSRSVLFEWRDGHGKRRRIALWNGWLGGTQLREAEAALVAFKSQRPSKEEAEKVAAEMFRDVLAAEASRRWRRWTGVGMVLLSVVLALYALRIRGKLEEAGRHRWETVKSTREGEFASAYRTLRRLEDQVRWVTWSCAAASIALAIRALAGSPREVGRRAAVALSIAGSAGIVAAALFVGDELPFERNYLYWLVAAALGAAAGLAVATASSPRPAEAPAPASGPA